MIQTRSCPIALIMNPPGPQQATPGSQVELFVTVSNQGDQSAVIDVFIDDSERDLRKWCDSPRQRLALDPKQSSEVAFRFTIPPQAFPGIYDYAIVVDAPEHYPEDTPLQRPRQLQLLPRDQQAVRVSDPTFALKPQTTPQQPLVVQPGKPQIVQIQVHNRSDRVDRFRLTCPDLEESWYSVRYQVPSLSGPGLVDCPDGLDLNPNTRGQIVLLFQPPTDTLSGSYSPTLRVYSANTPDLVLLDLVYLQIPTTYGLKVEIETLLGKVTRKPGRFKVNIANEGNVIRELGVGASSSEEDEYAAYECRPEEVRLLPGRSVGIDLTVKPKNWWQRPFWGEPFEIPFKIDLTDAKALPLPKTPPKAKLEWLARPWWQLLLAALLVLAALGGIFYLVWLVYFRAPDPVRVESFQSDSIRYLETNGDRITLNWQLRNPGQIRKITVNARAGNGQPVSKPMELAFGDQLKEVADLPAALKGKCQITEDLLACRNVKTDARKGGYYVFEMKVLQRRRDAPAVTTQSDLIEIVPKPKPKPEPLSKPVIGKFTLNGTAAPANVPLKIKTDTNPGDKVALSWQVTGKDVSVELETYGTFGPNGSLSLPPFTRAGQQIPITLKAVNKAGEVRRGFVIETFDPTPPPPGKDAPKNPGKPAAAPALKTAPEPTATAPAP
ncbi:MAG: hypothetical protein KME03_15340 [Aphanocapsa lilacina HA4352-LM1]|nr:hypothetical protein [Aphanocapsa lilacina HA4352-LM1]